MNITSENFIKQFKKRKEDALEYVIDEYIGIVKAVITNSLKSYNDPQSIEECISDTFLGAFDNAKQFKGEQVDFRKWICTIAKFKAIDKQRKMANSPATAEFEDYQIEVKSAEEEFLIKSSIEDLLKMMTKLEQVDRDIFTMKYFLIMKNEEIALQLGLTKASVDNRLYRGKKRLQQIRLGGAFN
ncbi:sigma-70 family RNA polymerase sigma factor [Filibacter tadaridae]|uniref:RNA polymerase factor sigma-70 n=1 Tax=Filibacter tadaridae TaxID=2483811 RepID=A0A3P5X0P1_9BACL|nr:sigma-70 family RNA polymerase sigma factor [Filibacter tadaridae]VDC24166.1 RNA polymerase factor sigma-70 [Filibacter tadaridae]